MSIIGDIYEGGGAKPVSFHNRGDTVEGVIENVRSKQLPKFGSSELERWPDGEPKMTPIITVQTSTFDDDDDDGRRDIYLRNNAFTAFGKALRETYKQKPSDSDLIGATLKIRFHDTAPSGKGNPRKLFLCRITAKPVSTTGDAWDQAPEAPTALGASDAPNADPLSNDDIPF